MQSSPSSPEALTYVKGSCHCRLNTFRVAFESSQLPIANDLCHCSSCRHATGQMAINQVRVTKVLCNDSDEPFRLGKGAEFTGDGELTAYQSSQQAIRYFCSGCSAHLFFQYLGDSKGNEEGKDHGAYVCVSTGALERVDGVIEPTFHQWVEDTLDGGLADHFRAVNGSSLPRHSQAKGSPGLPVGWRAATVQDEQQRDSLEFSCHCKSVQFSITRPNEDSTIPYSAYPDLLLPTDTTHLSRLRNNEDSKWWLRPNGSSQPTKYLAGYCVCSHCRLASGFEIQSWAYIPLADIFSKDGGRVKFANDKKDDLSKVREAVEKLGLRDAIHIPDERTPSGPRRLHGLKQYISSPGFYRESCATCGATVCSWKAGRPDLVCIATALVDEEQAGSRAEGWLEWHTDRVGYAEKALSKVTIDALMDGLRATKEEQAALPSHGRGLSASATATHVKQKSKEGASSGQPDHIQVEA